ncbi:Esterase E4 [Orchesella cincta]|uniref:Carboxylic ester hydrolase n=1 Tax=Orchesella cincta TaxID=48709 RepID=A0A1D2N7P1_ORCCI|nr:Esterase E4 [Orchesella cincta]
MLVTTYLVNLLCAVVECRGTMPLPEAYIAEYASPSFAQQRSIDPLNFTENIFLSHNSVNNDQSSRRKRLFSVLENNITNEPPQNGIRSFSSRLHSTMSDLVNVIPNFVHSVSRVMQNGNAREGSALGFRFGRSGADNNTVGVNAYGDRHPVVILKHGGGVEGYFMGTMNGRKLAAYEGIPYAEPPVKNRRFKAPEPKRPWKGIMKTQKPGNTCLQTHPLYFFRVTGDENCLFLNLYTPKIPYRDDNKTYPVLLWIHGGSFMYGSGSEYGPSYLLDQDIILVTANWRLGALGFLSTGDNVASGNWGLKDQALVLQWINKEIFSFGGDKNRVTIAGQSAGGVSAHLHLIANKVTDTFHHGMSLSGSGFGFWPVLSKERAGRLTKTLAKRLNCPYRSSTELIRCLKGISGSWIIMTQFQLFEWIPFHPLVLFAPTVEPEGADSYLTKWPADAYANLEVQKKPWIFGQTSKEGHFETYQLKLFMQAPNMAMNIKKYLPMILDYDYYTTEPVTSAVTQKLMQYYDGNPDKNGLGMDTISDMYTDRYFSNTLQKAIRAHSRIAPTKTYAYIFDYTGKYNLGQLFGVPRSEWASAHTEDVMMIFNSSSFHHGLSKRDVEYQLSEIMTNVVSNFAATGEPNYRGGNNNMVKLWGNAIDPMDSQRTRIQYLRFGNKVEMFQDPFRNRVKFWERLGIPT